MAYTRIFKPDVYFKNASIGRVVVVALERKYGLGHDLMKASILAIKNYFKEPYYKFDNCQHNSDNVLNIIYQAVERNPLDIVFEEELCEICKQKLGFI